MLRGFPISLLDLLGSKYGLFVKGSGDGGTLNGLPLSSYSSFIWIDVVERGDRSIAKVSLRNICLSESSILARGIDAGTFAPPLPGCLDI